MSTTGVPALALPRLTAAVDCGPIGYDGLKVHFWLNVTYDPDRESDEAWMKRAEAHEKATGQKLRREDWETDYYYSLGRIVELLEIPGDFTADGNPAEIPIPDGKALRELMLSKGFEQSIILWASQQYYRLKAERLRAEAKN